MPELYELTATEAADAIRRRSISPLDLVDALLTRIERLDPRIRAWVTLDADGARSAARRAEVALKADGEPRGPLHGVPVALKDIYYTRGLRTTACFPPMEQFVPDRDAASVDRLRAAGAIVLGKTVTTQFAYADPPPTRNPWRADRTPGGSSSGSAAAVSARMVPIAIGSQTAGSILRPAAYCGIVGLKPTHGLVDAANVLPLSWSLDHVGPMARSVEDVELVLGALADGGASAASATTSDPPRLGLVIDALERAQPDVAAHCRDVGARFEAVGGAVREVRLPVPFDLVLAIHRVTMQAEDAAAHAFGIARWRDAYSPRIRTEAMVGQLIPVTYYLHAQRLRRRARAAVAELFDEIDALLLPTASNVAPSPETTGDPSFQAPWSLFGMPSITLPSGVNADGLPFGTQLVAPRGAETRLLAVASWCERVLGFDRRPPID